jgi:hypothetical protein
MSTENIEAHLRVNENMISLSNIVESNIDTQLVLSKRLAKVENELRVSQRAGVLKTKTSRLITQKRLMKEKIDSQENL